MVNLEWFRTFKTIYESGTLTGAANRLLVSQPNVSQHLSSLEHHVGYLLFERTARKMIPTEQGKQLYYQIVDPLKVLEHIEGNFKKQIIQSTTLHLGTSKEFFHAKLAHKLTCSECRISAKYGESASLANELINGNLDFIISSQRIDLKNVLHEVVLTETNVMVSGKNLDTSVLSNLLENNNIIEAEKWLACQQWYDTGNLTDSMTKFWLENFKKPPDFKPRHIIPDVDTIVKAISFGEGLTIIPDYLITDYIENNKLKIVWKGIKPVSNPLLLIYFKDKTTKKCIDLIHNLIS